MRASALLLLALAACGPTTSPPDAGGCQEAALSPPNLVSNAGFECGGAAPAEWQQQYGTLELVADAHGGARAAKVTATGTLGQFAYATPVFTATKGGTWCARAWMKGTVASAKLSVMVDTGGGGTDYTQNAPLSASWLRVPTGNNLQVPATAGAKVYLRFVMNTPKAGDTLVVDDVDLWESGDGLCRER